MDRIDQGLKPACVSKCVTHCLHFGLAEQLDTTRRERLAKAVAFELDTVVSAR
jgi:Fe-S-cluster-containing dehydrogenase component